MLDMFASDPVVELPIKPNGDQEGAELAIVPGTVEKIGASFAVAALLITREMSSCVVVALVVGDEVQGVVAANCGQLKSW
jgi:hypothetical protein